MDCFCYKIGLQAVSNGNEMEEDGSDNPNGGVVRAMAVKAQTMTIMDGGNRKVAIEVDNKNGAWPSLMMAAAMAMQAWTIGASQFSPTLTPSPSKDFSLTSPPLGNSGHLSPKSQLILAKG